MLWLVGQHKGEIEGKMVWEFQGIFETEELAQKACIFWNYFYHAVELNESIIDKTVDFSEIVYPSSSPRSSEVITQTHNAILQESEAK